MFEEIKKRLTAMFGLDGRSLALMRVLFGVILLFDLANRARSIIQDYTDAGALPRKAWLTFYHTDWIFSLHLMAGSWQIEAVLFLIAAAFAVMLLLGYKTRLATIISWILLISLQTRNPLILQGGDVLLRLGLFWAIFLPWGQYYSADAAKRSLQQKPATTKSPWHVSGATIAYITQIALVYWLAFAFKSGPEWFPNGTAIYYALSIDQFATYLGHWLLSFPALLTYMTFGVLALEAFAPFLFFFPIGTKWTRLAAALGIIGFHLGLALSMHLGPFPYIGIASATALLPSIFWDFLEKVLRRAKNPITIYYDAECGFCKIWVQYLRVFFILDQAILIPAAQNQTIFLAMMAHNSWIITDNQGRHYTKFQAFQPILASSPVFWPLAPLVTLPGIKQLGNWAYQAVSHHHQKKCLVVNRQYHTPHDKFANAKRIGASTIALLLIGYIALWNLWQFAPTVYTMPPAMQNLGMLLRLDQRWDMFSPSPLKDDGWYVIDGHLRNGKEIDVFNHGQPVSFAKPAHVANTYQGERARKYLMNIWQASYADYRMYYAQYLCRTWNNNHEHDQQLMTFDIIFMLEETPPPGSSLAPVKPVTIWQHHCFD